MSESEIEGFINKVESGLVEAQHDMLVEKALYNRPVVISDGNGGVVEVSAKQLLNQKRFYHSFNQSRPVWPGFLKQMIMKQVEERYISFEASKMAYRDIKNSVDTAKREGIAEGMEKGMELGMNQKALDIARNMLADGVDINLIMKYSGLTQEQIEKLK